MNFKKTYIACSVAAMSLALISCGGDSGSQDSGANSSTSFTGLVVDGRIANGFVWIDTDDDGAIDLYEPYAYTDSDGYYSYNPLTNTNYCLDSSHQNCLRTNIVDGQAKIKIAGGTDLDSGESFQGVMVLTTTRAEAREQEASFRNITQEQSVKPDFIPMISPLTSLLSGIDEPDYSTMLTNVGVTSSSSVSDLLKRDYTNLADTTDLSLIKATYRVQKIVDSMSVILDERASNKGVNLGLNSDGKPTVGSSSEYVLAALRDQLGANDLDNVVIDLSGVVDGAADKLATQLAALDKSTSASDIKNKLAVDQISNQTSLIAKQVSDSVKAGFDTVASTGDKTNLRASILAAETLVTKVKKAAIDLAKVSNSSDTTISTETNNFASVVQNAKYRAAIIDGLKIGQSDEQVVDVASLSSAIETQINDAGGSFDADTVAQNSQTAVENNALENVSSAIWASKTLSLSGQYTSGDTTEKGRAILFFQPESTSVDTKGKVALCFAYNDGDSDTSTDDKDDIRGDYLSGTWTELNTRGIVSLTIEGKTFRIKAFNRQVITDTDEQAKFLGVNASGNGSPGTPGSDEYAKFRFTYDSDTYDWYSDRALDTTNDANDWGLDAYSTFPTGKSNCEALTNLETNVFDS